MCSQSSISRPSFNWISTFFLIRAFGKKLARVSSAQQCSAGRLRISKAWMPVTFLHDTNFPFRFVSDGFLHFQFEHRCLLQTRKIMYRSCKGLLKVCLVKGLREYAIYEEIWSLKRIIKCNALLEWPPNKWLSKTKAQFPKQPLLK